MQQDTTGARRSTRRVSALVAVGMLLGVVLAPVAQTATAAPASAAPVALPAVSAQLQNHRGTTAGGAADGSTAQNCIRFQPASGQWSATEALAAHGGESSFFGMLSCPTNLSTTSQSAIGLAPNQAAPETGTTFLLGSFRHYNNPINAQAEYFRGTLNLRLGTSAAFVSSSYVLRETPNSANPAGNVANNDTVTFTDLVRSSEVQVNGMTYRLTVRGFTTAGTGNAQCTRVPTSGFSDVVSTVEQTTTVACLWARLDQVRPVTVVKEALAAGDAPATVPGFTFTASEGTATQSATLTPAGTTAPTNTASVQAGNRTPTAAPVTITEGAAPAGWELTGIVCRDGSGSTLTTGVATSGRTVVLGSVPDATTVAALPIVCTFTNTYVAPTVLTLVSQTVPDGRTAPQGTAGWTFTVDAVAGPLTTAGAAGSAATTVAVPAATRVVRVTETVQAGYVVDLVTCTGTDGSSVTVSANPVDLTVRRGRSYTCTVVNLRPGVQVVKEAFLATDTAFTSPVPAGRQLVAGTAVVWRYTVRNTGQTRLTGLVLRDSWSATGPGVPTTSGATTITCPGLTPATTVTIPSLASGASIACTAPGVL
ncbi:prealbumin-like fold domain-containing protein [Cellulomonas shaoxiangyii]|uniref:SpaA-like prealbumin fold domain-containing protein n=1 Tax=Cellulomonas shaoxiangyii TaxID=2566013 RepID=A0A4P7SK67_9CELL|nr:choice-of-anchor K domain-containing protein [Cellulomonas shaoxiangyii]QCB92923.1 hypothetical protein E5225_04480 [Cellulomonas shaoxiangyii]TGY85389.1 hypothetical protein E5226_06765 [Cellulomonas shaoxiangyii]